MKTNQEEWRWVVGYENIYEVSNRGSVRSYKNGKHGLKKTPHPMNGTLNKHGYHDVTLRKNGVSKTKKVHRLIAGAFIDNPESKPSINHIDGNKANNWIENLEWVTPRENLLHSYNMGMHKNGEGHPNSKLTTDEVMIVKLIKRVRPGFNVAEVARVLGRNYDTVFQVWNENNWSHQAEKCLKCNQKDREWRERMVEVLESMTFNNVFCCPRYIKGNCYCDALDRYKSHGKSNLLVRLKRWKQKQIKKLKDNQ